MNISENALNVLTAKSYRGIGKAWVVKNLKGGESVEKIVALLNENSKQEVAVVKSDFRFARENIRMAITKSLQEHDAVAAIGDSEFPECRGNVKSSEQPVALFYRGNIGLLAKNSKNIAVIGLLSPDEEIELVEREVVSKLVGYGATIVSGLALGCDTIAHKQALSSTGKTVAILPSALNDILPSANKGLADEIVRKGGLIVTEYYDKAKSKMELNGRYQERDRLQALFSDCVVLAASYAKNDMGLDSGSRLAMEYAANYSIPRAVMYDSEVNSDNPKYDLNRQCIREQNGLAVINRRNMNRVVAEIVSNRSQPPVSQVGQADLFG